MIRPRRFRFYQRLLLVMAFSLVILMLIYPYIANDVNDKFQYLSIPKMKLGGFIIEGANLKGADKQNQEYYITAKMLSTDENNDEITHLTEPTGKITLKDGKKYEITANIGTANKNTKILYLNDDVKLVNVADNIQLNAQDLQVFWDKKEFFTQNKITGRTDKISFNSQGLKVLQEGNIIKLVGHSKVSIMSK